MTQIDGELFSIFARVKDQKDVDYVRDEILQTFKRYSTELVPQKELDETRSRTRYGLAMGMNSSEAIAGILAPYIALKRTPETLNKLFDVYTQITPEDVRRTAAKYFVDRNRTIVTLATDKKKEARQIMNRIEYVPPAFNIACWPFIAGSCDCDLGFNRTSDGSAKRKPIPAAIKRGPSTQSLAANHLPHPFHDRFGFRPGR